MLFYYGLDYYYLVLVLPAILLMTIAQISVKTTFSKYSQKFCNVTGAEAARRVLSANGVSGVRIERVSGNLTEGSHMYGLYQFKRGFNGQLDELAGEFDKVYRPVALRLVDVAIAANDKLRKLKRKLNK